MTKPDFKTKIIIIYFFSFCIAILLSGWLFAKMSTVNTSLNKIHIQVGKINQISGIKENIFWQQAKIRSFMLYENENDLREFRVVTEKGIKAEEELINIIREERKPIARKILDLNIRYIEICEREIIPLIKQGQRDMAIKAAFREDALIIASELVRLTDDIENMRKKDMQNTIDISFIETRFLIKMVTLLSIFFMLGGGILSMLVIRKIMRDAEIYRMVLATSKSAIITVNSDGTITNFNYVAESIFDEHAQNMVGRKFDKVFTGQKGIKQIALNYSVDDIIKSGESRIGVELEYISIQGLPFTLLMDCMPFKNKKGKVFGAMFIARDITERKIIENKLRGMAVRDSLTKLYNHNYLLQRLNDEIKSAVQEKNPMSFIIIDIDNFKYYNDSFGHQAGDILLEMFADLLKNCLRPTDIIGRYGGDEFAVILPSTNSKTAVEIAEFLRETIQGYNFHYKEQLLGGQLTASIGIAAYPDNADSGNQLIKLADEAMYHAKRTAKNKVEFYFSAAEMFKDKNLDENVEDASVLSTLKILLWLINAKDRYTYAHSEKVACYAELIAKNMDMPCRDVENIKMAAFLHDVGKIEISRSVLCHDGKLTDEDWEIMRQHPVWGADTVRAFALLAPLVPMILYHHERYDGSGYPEGLKGDSISLGARIIAVADSFDAMSTNRPYKAAKSLFECKQELLHGCGSQFDPVIVDIFLRSIEKSELLM